MSEYTISTDHLYAANIVAPTYVICISGTDGKMLAGIKPDGSIEYGPNYAPDEAARTFWRAIGAGWLGFLAPIIEQEISRRAA